MKKIMYIFHFWHYSFDMWANPLNHISPHASSRSLGQWILTIFSHHTHQSWLDQLNEMGQHGKIVFQPEHSDHILAADFPTILTVQISHHLNIPTVLISLSENFHFNWPNLSATGLNIECGGSPSSKSDNWIFNSNQPNLSTPALNIGYQMGPADQCNNLIFNSKLSAAAFNIECRKNPSDQSDNWTFNSNQPNLSGPPSNIESERPHPICKITEYSIPISLTCPDLHWI